MTVTACGGGAGASPAGGSLPPGNGAGNPVKQPSSGWRITVYYTPVQKFYSGPLQSVTGCLALNCANGTAPLGVFPSDFVTEVKNEGTGKISSGAYLNWSVDTGYWLDTATRDDRGNTLVPYQSAAADPSVAFGTSFRVVSCGADSVDGTPTSDAVCAAYRAAAWVVTDRFSQGAVGKHVDLYIGEQDTAAFTQSAKYIDASNAVLQF